MLRYLMKATVNLLLIALLISSASGQAKPRVYSFDAELLQQAKARLTAQDATLQPALNKLRRDADKALKIAPFSVTQKERTPPSGDKHDYLSLAPYWWPDPQSKDGLPYIRRDGEVQPDSKRGTDALVIGQMAETVETLALAYYFTGAERYAQQATLLLRVWFLDPATKMNPHLRYAQAILGRNNGRGAGLVEGRHFIRIVDAIGLLSETRAWTDQDQEKLRTWFREFINWMQTSPHGQDEQQAKNNHGSWYAGQLACYALFVGDDELARKTAAAARVRIAWQVEPDGKQPFELARTRGLGYSAFNLIALLTLAEAGRQVGVDLYGYQTRDGRSLRRALDYLANFADPAQPWPHQQINKADGARADLAYLLRRGALAFREPQYERLLTRHLAKAAALERWQLLWPR